MQNRIVAVIGDDKKFLNEIEKILLMSDYLPVSFNNAFSAVDVVVQSKPDVVLLELSMPGRNGFELIDLINRVFGKRRIPLIVMSDFFKDGFDWLLDSCGIKRWLKKPFQPLDLIWAIENGVEESNKLDREKRLFGMKHYKQIDFENV